MARFRRLPSAFPKDDISPPMVATVVGGGGGGGREGGSGRVEVFFHSTVALALLFQDEVASAQRKNSRDGAW